MVVWNRIDYFLSIFNPIRLFSFVLTSLKNVTEMRHKFRNVIQILSVKVIFRQNITINVISLENVIN